MYYYLLCWQHYSIILTHLFIFLCLKLIISTCYPSLCWISSHKFKNHCQKLTFRWTCTNHFVTISGTMANFLANCFMRNMRQWFSCGWDFPLSIIYRLIFFLLLLLTILSDFSCSFFGVSGLLWFWWVGFSNIFKCFQAISFLLCFFWVTNLLSNKLMLALLYSWFSISNWFTFLFC
jgi:hypothetical protein